MVHCVIYFTVPLKITFYLLINHKHPHQIFISNPIYCCTCRVKCLRSAFVGGKKKKVNIFSPFFVNSYHNNISYKVSQKYTTFSKLNLVSCVQSHSNNNISTPYAFRVFRPKRFSLFEFLDTVFSWICNLLMYYIMYIRVCKP